MSKSVFICQNCGAVLKKWSGQCPECHEWNTITEEKEEGVFLFGESGLSDPLSPLDSLEELDPLDKMGLSDLLEMELLELAFSLEEELLEFIE